MVDADEGVALALIREKGVGLRGLCLREQDLARILPALLRRHFIQEHLYRPREAVQNRSAEG